jgi:rubredoxin
MSLTLNTNFLTDFGIQDPCDKSLQENNVPKLSFNEITFKNDAFKNFIHISSVSEATQKIVGMTYKPFNKVELDIEIKNQIINYDKCLECKVYFHILEDVMVCPECGVEKDLNDEYSPETYNATIDSNYNSSTTASTSFTFSGKKSYGYQKAILKSCSDYSTTSFQTIKKEILHRINMYEGNRPPMNLQLNCIDTYYSIKENDKIYLDIINKSATESTEKKRLVFRSNGKWGLIAACLYNECIKEGLTRTPREIAEIIGIDVKYLLAGDKKLQEFHELGIVDLPINVTPLNDYICRYFPLLGIPDKYKEFIIDLINRAEIKFLHICNENRSSTKCIGAIYLLCTRIPELKHLNRDYIARECKISKSTFIRYYNILINNWQYIKKVFKKHKIPMPKDWKQ